jgi:hypothetical protein
VPLPYDPDMDIELRKKAYRQYVKAKQEILQEIEDMLAENPRLDLGYLDALYYES